MDIQPLRLFADKNKLADWAYIPLLYPFWGSLVKDTLPYQKIAYEKHGWDPNYFTLVEKPEDAEYIVLPHDYWWMKWNRKDLLAQYVALSKRYDRPLLVEALGDTTGKVRLPCARILRNNQFRFHLPDDEITTPYAVEDLLESYCDGKIVFREKSAVPSVGFIGFAGLAPLQRLRTMTKEIPIRLRTLIDRRYVTYWSGRFWREWMMDAFEPSGRVVSNFIKRPSYSGHIKTVAGDMQKNRLEFVHNILDADYSLVIRGDPNASQRFYEVLALGRIPALIDTECVLPLEHLIDYRECCVIIDYHDLARAPDILADFHAALSPEKFRQMQERARFAYEHYLRIDSFSKFLPELLRPAPHCK